MLQLAWSSAREPERLRIDYTVTNVGTTILHVVDDLIWANTVMSDGVIVRNDVEANTVAFTRAYITTPAKLYVMPPGPTFVALDPNATMTRLAYVRLPLTEWHNFDRVDPLVPGASRAVLEVGYIDNPESKLVAWKWPNGGEIHVATHLGSQKLARSDVKPLPL